MTVAEWSKQCKHALVMLAKLPELPGKRVFLKKLLQQQLYVHFVYIHLDILVET